jgi:hypothetical protein
MMAIMKAMDTQWPTPLDICVPWKNQNDTNPTGKAGI